MYFTTRFVILVLTMKLQTPAINLLPRDPFYETPVGKLLGWAMNVGKYILMFTQLVVLLSFAARFTLDRQLTDLNTSIVRNVGIIDSYGELENIIRSIQQKTTFIKQYSSLQHPGDFLLLLSKATPTGVRLKGVQFGTQQIGITGTTLDASSLSQFIVNLQSIPEFSNISVGDIKNNESNDPGLQFTINIVLSAQGTKKK